MKSIKALFAAVGMISLMGCAGAGSIMKAAAKDQAIVAVRVGTPWGVQQVTRVGGSTNSVTVAPDGTVTVNAK